MTGTLRSHNRNTHCVFTCGTGSTLYVWGAHDKNWDECCLNWQYVTMYYISGVGTGGLQHNCIEAVIDRHFNLIWGAPYQSQGKCYRYVLCIQGITLILVDWHATRL